MICFVIKNPRLTAGLKCAIEIFPKMDTPMGIPTNGAKAIRDNDRETSRVAVNGAKMLEEATHLENSTIESNLTIQNRSS